MAKTPNLNADITRALEGWSVEDNTPFDRLDAIKLKILEGRYGGGVTLDTLKASLEAMAQEFIGSGIADEDWRLRWANRTESFANSVEETIRHFGVEG